MKIDILEKACYLLTTLKKSIFSKATGPGLQTVASFSTKTTFFSKSVIICIIHYEPYQIKNY